MIMSKPSMRYSLKLGLNGNFDISNSCILQYLPQGKISEHLTAFEKYLEKTDSGYVSFKVRIKNYLTEKKHCTDLLELLFLFLFPYARSISIFV